MQNYPPQPAPNPGFPPAAAAQAQQYNAYNNPAYPQQPQAQFNYGAPPAPAQAAAPAAASGQQYGQWPQGTGNYPTSMSYQPPGATSQGAGVQTDVTQGQRRTDGLGGFSDYDPTTGLSGIDPNNQSANQQAYGANATASELLDQYSDGRRPKK